jgi:metal-responsive CopG/Arc/MetJ family transcriptional regulator
MERLDQEARRDGYGRKSEIVEEALTLYFDKRASKAQKGSVK